MFKVAFKKRDRNKYRANMEEKQIWKKTELPKIKPIVTKIKSSVDMLSTDLDTVKIYIYELEDRPE